MKTKICAKCDRRKSVGSFTKNASEKDGLNHSCKRCHSEYTARHYRSNKAYYVEKARKHEQAIRDCIVAAKSKPCADCGKKYPYYVMDLDHLDGYQKKFTISEMGRRSGLRKVLVEIAKCEAVCANCHRVRTWTRMKHSPS